MCPPMQVKKIHEYLNHDFRIQKFDNKNSDLTVKNTFFDTKICIIKIMI